MDQFRRSNVPLNQSQSLYTSNVMSSNAANLSQYESAQIDLMYYLKWVILVIGVVIAAIFLKALFGGAPCKTDCDAQPTYFQSFKNYIAKTFSFGRSRARPKPADKEPPREREYQSSSESRGRERAERQTEKPEGQKEGFWSNILPSAACKGLSDFKEKLKNYRFAVRPFLPEMPSVEAIKATPARFNISLSEMSTTPASEIKYKFPPERLVG